jgi:hypothetical protein
MKTLLIALAIASSVSLTAKAEESGAHVVDYGDVPPPLVITNALFPKWETPSAGEYAALGVTLGLIWWDVGQTRYWRRNFVGFYESNPVLGRYPSEGRIFWIGGVAASVVTVVAFVVLPPKWRYVLCAGISAAETYVVLKDGYLFKVHF